MATDTIKVVDDEVTDETKVLTELEHEHYEEIKELNNEFREEYSEWECLKDKTGSAKKRVDEISKRLSYLIARGPDYQKKLPFEDAEAGESLGWRDQLIAGELGLTAKVLEKLEEAGVTTIGELEDLRGGAGLRSIGGIGVATADKIEAQVLEWLTENRDKFGETVAESEDDEDANDEESDDDI
jgi:hypothetical protein